MRITACLLVLLAGAMSATAQEPPTLPPPSERQTGAERGGMRGPGAFSFISSEMKSSGKTVKGAAYSGQGITETVQTLSDGNRVIHKTTVLVYRDREGRTRRDQTLGAIGPWAAAGDPPQVIFISDPPTGVQYILDPRARTARKSKFSANDRPFILPGPPVPTSPAKTESLGKRTIEGVEAEGARTTIIIPTGEVGNERPIEIVSERWYSPELQTIVMTRHRDPRFGETVFRLTNINRSDPSPSLFEVPADYTVKEETAHPGFPLKRKNKPEDDF
jgi:hypothetical protein